MIGASGDNADLGLYFIGYISYLVLDIKWRRYYNMSMNKFKIYYTDPIDSKCYSRDCDTLSDTLLVTETFRKNGMTFVTMVSENVNSVGKPGVDSIKDGVCPDGVAYTWMKRRSQ
jgi:hypothetical protein